MNVSLHNDHALDGGNAEQSVSGRSGFVMTETRHSGSVYDSFHPHIRGVESLCIL